MKRQTILLLLSVLLLSGGAAAQSTKEQTLEDLNRTAALYYCYENHPRAAATPAPEGYEPFYISHYGRLCRIRARSTLVPRCMLSMAAANERLKELNPAIDITREASKRYLDYMFRMTEANKIKKEIKQRIAELREREIDPSRFVRALVTDPSLVGNRKEQLRFMNDLYCVASVMQDVDYLDCSFYDLFTFDELCRFWECDNYTYYVEKGPDPRNRGRGTALAETLLDDIVSRAGEDMAAGEPSVRLRFGHDGCIMALLTLMRIDGWTTPVTDPAKIKDVWQVHRIPMASNMQFVFYRNKKNPDDVLVRVLLNEKELRLPLPGDRAPYYR